MKSNILPALREFAANRKKELTAVLCAVLILGLVLASVWAVSERRKDPSGWSSSGWLRIRRGRSKTCAGRASSARLIRCWS